MMQSIAVTAAIVVTLVTAAITAKTKFGLKANVYLIQRHTF